jgi:hypothetical protein
MSFFMSQPFFTITLFSRRNLDRLSSLMLRSGWQIEARRWIFSFVSPNMRTPQRAILSFIVFIGTEVPFT